MTAVQYNQTAIFEYLLKFEVNITAKCRNTLYVNELDMYSLGKAEQNSLSRERCADGMSIMDLLVVHWNLDMRILLHSNKLANWEDRDDDQSTPLHYAFCHSNYDFIQIAVNRNLNFIVLSKNGSTPYHSAVVCNSISLHVFLMMDTKHKPIIPDVKDNKGLSILQYGSIQTNSHNTHYEIMNNNQGFLPLFQIAIDFKHNIYNTDDFGGTFLHYAAQNGNYIQFSVLLEALPHAEITNLLRQEDKFGQTPVDELFTTMSKQKKTEQL
ncbi:unnamed protein product [Mytilus coruscus]|uniref:Uncharacterized protein n=1 Tax=Mytilus coruscus TaxID=42192 RepID=A0A6J8BQN4_MYTCO|nr:unnamed protein product [Mytilus coruscus]